jgi:hypothetical protein
MAVYGQGRPLVRTSTMLKLANHDYAHNRTSSSARVLAAMPEHDREALLLVVWDGLATGRAAQVLACRRGERPLASRDHHSAPARAS